MPPAFSQVTRRELDDEALDRLALMLSQQTDAQLVS